MTTQNTQVRMIGITDETHTCELCGKTNLKRVVVLDIDGDIVRYGSDCAARKLNKAYKGIKNTVDFWGKFFNLYGQWVAAGHSMEVIYKGLANRGAHVFMFEGEILAVVESFNYVAMSGNQEVVTRYNAHQAAIVKEAADKVAAAEARKVWAREMHQKALADARWLRFMEEN